MLPAGRPIVVDGRYLSDHYPGVGRWVYELLLALPAVDPARRVRALVDRDASQRRFDLDALVSRGVELVPSRTPRSLRGQLSAAGACRREAAAVYHAPHVLSAGRVPCASVVTLYDTIPLRDAQPHGAPHRRLAFGLLLRRALARATRVITLTEATRRDIVRTCGVPPERITVTGAAAGPQFRPAAPDAVESLRRRLGLRAPYALYVGSSKPHKNLARLVQQYRVGGFHVFGGSEPAPNVLLNPGYASVILGQPFEAAATYNRLAQAKLLENRLKEKKYVVRLKKDASDGKTTYVVWVGPVAGKKAAQETAQRLKSEERLTVRLVKFKPPAPARSQ
jgi:hypothetical protein